MGVISLGEAVTVNCIEDKCMFWVEERHTDGRLYIGGHGPTLPAHCAIMHDIVKWIH